MQGRTAWDLRLEEPQGVGLKLTAEGRLARTGELAAASPLAWRPFRVSPPAVAWAATGQPWEVSGHALYFQCDRPCEMRAFELRFTRGQRPSRPGYPHLADRRTEEWSGRRYGVGSADLRQGDTISSERLSS